MRIISILSLILTVFCVPVLAADLTLAQQRQAKQLLSSLGCRACHDFDKSGSTLAGSLDRIGLKMTAAQIEARLQLPVKDLGQGKKFMPSYQTTAPDQLRLLSRFLAARK